ncbi:hypothetical protein PENTCL1PPCAC_541, partial [Pristionchus entomophagus]
LVILFFLLITHVHAAQESINDAGKQENKGLDSRDGHSGNGTIDNDNEELQKAVNSPPHTDSLTTLHTPVIDNVQIQFHNGQLTTPKFTRFNVTLYSRPNWD